ncbi:hypothetical protein AAWM_00020 [Aspergillus awamori]|uniref:Contig An07c0010, genomic contig n=7 Tax=Aspergillus TaxID=5052 RepID=A2QLX7_ASPNC|nr:uncharacterized protein An07g00070 [Aspergillus niger]XP_025460442.1 uncharacterized protein BO96DRAFT_407060 [Aspergillus niger CBS 101883]RDH15143.1 hypothetical protein M747DRAFT_374581 [Aspergillus niger ATCC 13496]RDK38256.1 hypothetical protein M752DRAFT_279194 [Aspergillus phoenicis ATCC 13157]GCB17135.1 hypothetical protein AAWM_00020 [Aspergillus awamori]KAI2816250.1 hypothetical protein CBS115989_7042 [Aspergillus niger]KAI2831935.1 hypothetical protein CBS133816_1812 [Aspergillu|eukprot:XP_001391100.1 hypothetical protein ANI_1_8064 [Aspergillus niger CBS 513.88]
MSTYGTRDRILRLRIAHYKTEDKTEAEAHKFGTLFAEKAAHLHEKHGIWGYAQVYTPEKTRKVVEAMNQKANRGWVIDDHDFAVEFYFKTLEDLSKVSRDPEFHALQAEEVPYISKHHVVTSLGWVETFVEHGKVVHIENGKSTYGTFEEMQEITMDPNYRKPADGTNNSQ